MFIKTRQKICIIMLQFLNVILHFFLFCDFPKIEPIKRGSSLMPLSRDTPPSSLVRAINHPRVPMNDPDKVPANKPVTPVPAQEDYIFLLHHRLEYRS